MIPKPNYKPRKPKRGARGRITKDQYQLALDWLPVKGYEELYMISNDGRVRNRSKQMKLQINKWGYPAISLCKQGKRNTLTVHRLVASHFIENADNKPCVNHMDGVKDNNSVDNLEWVTYKENAEHARSTGLYDNKRAVKQVVVECETVVGVFDSIKKASIKTGIKRNNIGSVLRRTSQTAGGYKWEYVEELEGDFHVS